MKNTNNIEFTKLKTGFYGSLSLVLNIIFVIFVFPLFSLENISDVTLNRIHYKIPITTGHSEWLPVSADEFPWTSPEYVAGWQRRADSKSKAGIYLSLFPIKHDLQPGEYKNSLAGTLKNDYGAVLSEQTKINFGDYEAEILRFSNSKKGNGLDFVTGNIPTTAIYFKVELEKEKAPSAIWPVLIIYCAAPTKYFAKIENEFELFLENLIITPPLTKEDIINLQNILTNLGFNIGEIDGLMGPQTYSAIKKFQISNNLTASGYVDYTTLKALEKDSDIAVNEENQTFEVNDLGNIFSSQNQNEIQNKSFLDFIKGDISLIILGLFVVLQFFFLIIAILVYSTFKKYITFRMRDKEKNK